MIKKHIHQILYFCILLAAGACSLTPEVPKGECKLVFKETLDTQIRYFYGKDGYLEGTINNHDHLPCASCSSNSYDPNFSGTKQEIGDDGSKYSRKYISGRVVTETRYSIWGGIDRLANYFYDSEGRLSYSLYGHPVSFYVVWTLVRYEWDENGNLAKCRYADRSLFSGETPDIDKFHIEHFNVYQYDDKPSPVTSVKTRQGFNGTYTILGRISQNNIIGYQQYWTGKRNNCPTCPTDTTLLNNKEYQLKYNEYGYPLTDYLISYNMVIRLYTYYSYSNPPYSSAPIESHNQYIVE